MYKDKDKQREADRQRQRRYRSSQKGVTTEGVTTEGVTEKALPGFIGANAGSDEFTNCKTLPANFGQPDCQCRHCQNNRVSGSKLIINHGPIKSAGELSKYEINRVSLPGDSDYEGVA